MERIKILLIGTGGYFAGLEVGTINQYLQALVLILTAAEIIRRSIKNKTTKK